MRIHSVLLAAVAAFALPSAASAADLKPGVYVGSFDGGMCGVLTIPDGNKKPTYAYGKCELGKIIGKPEYKAQRVSISENGDKIIVKIDEARYTIRLVAGKMLLGTWTLGDYTNTNMQFKLDS